MIEDNSILRRLPPSLDRKQALYFDGIRHCAEIADLAYSRLKDTLTLIAGDDGIKQPDNQHLFTSAFLDAWSLVDVIDRFRSLWTSLPNIKRPTPNPGQRTFAEIAQPVRDLRNVADHIAQRADYIVAHKGTALGVLSWFTVLKRAPMEGVICTIIPGTARDGSYNAVNPAGQKIEYPSGLVHLSAGEFTANLSETLSEMEIRVQDTEQAVKNGLEKYAPNAGESGADFLLQMLVSFGKPAA